MPQYPNQPFYIRGVEVGLAGVLVGAIFLRWGIVPVLVWHYTVDAGYTSLLMLRSGNLYYVLSGLAAAGILLVPLGFALVRYWRRGGFEPEEGLRNADLGVVPEPAAAAEAPREIPSVTPVPRSRRMWTAVAAAILMLTFLVPARLVTDGVTDRIGRAQSLARADAFVRSQGVPVDEYRRAAYTGTGFADESGMDYARPDETGRLAGFSSEAARYVLEHGGTAAFLELTELQLPVGLRVVRYFKPGEKAEWKVEMDARQGRIIAFAHPVEEADSAGPPPSRAEAERRAIETARQLGYPVARYAVIDTGTQARPHRVDTRVTLESRTAVGGARTRITTVFQGDRLAALWPSLKVPEDYLRTRRARGPLYYVGMVIRVVAGGTLLSVLLLVVIAAFRSGAFRRAHLFLPVAVWTVLAALSAINAWPSFWRLYPTEIPLTTYQATLVLGIILRVLVASVIALLALALIGATCPGWRQALRRSGTWPDAFARAAVAAGGYAGVRQLGRILADRFPTAFEVRASLPSSLDAWAPGYEAFIGGAQLLMLLAASTAVVALALRSPPYAHPRSRWIGAAMVLVLLAPIDAKTPLEFLGPFTTGALGVAWTLATVLLLGDHAAAWALYGLLLVGRGAVDLLQQGAPDDRSQGILALALALAVIAALTLGRRVQPHSSAIITPSGPDMPM